ncbi:methyltransferase domain-containing protein [Natronoglycomyces albus]|uniref:methyltransferase domain-containing protein n=1 Tax=Natronoglycomyces albus TaxID=2811108 RepID=UPI001FEBB870|nr:methyltransferase domain-containing protein [Natronoglycomyces albus]
MSTASKHQQTSRNAVVWAVLNREIERQSALLTQADPDPSRQLASGLRKLRIVDVGGGSGGIAVPLAELGHEVTVVDPSANALAALRQRTADAGLEGSVAAVQADTEELSDTLETGSADLVLCHSVLEHVDHPQRALESIADVVAEGGAVSLLVANRAAAVFAKALGGQFQSALNLLYDVEGRLGESDTVAHRFETHTLTALVNGCGLATEHVHGVQVVSDLIPGSVLESEGGSKEALREFELATAARIPFRDLAAQLHVLARKPRTL